MKRTGGSYLYEAEGGPRPPPPPGKKPPPAPLRIPETFEAPQPLTIFSDYLGADPVAVHPPPLDGALGHMGYAWDPRIVGAGGYTLMGSMFDSGTTPTQGMVGHQLVLDLDAQWTGTERIHVQFRPLGPRNTGGSFYRFTAPVEYLDNFTAVPDRYWFEGELHSLLGLSSSAYLSDVRVTAGKFPLQLHNNLLVNDELVGVSLSQSTLVPPRLGSLSLAGFYAWNDVDSTTVSDSQVAGLHLSTEYRTMLVEATGAYVNNDIDSRRDQLHTALSATYFKGPRCFVGRALGKWGDAAGTGPGQLFVLETNRSWDFETPRWG
ncbi:MAG TPA: hypothetical protein PLV92_30410, partial [Pirellulaceae bacterium]|nr:hypothetical protein [Pirellulaceae bacterium]